MVKYTPTQYPHHKSACMMGGMSIFLIRRKGGGWREDGPNSVTLALFCLPDQKALAHKRGAGGGRKPPTSAPCPEWLLTSVPGGAVSLHHIAGLGPQKALPWEFASGTCLARAKIITQPHAVVYVPSLCYGAGQLQKQCPDAGDTYSLNTAGSGPE